jgi:hypothetical protein
MSGFGLVNEPNVHSGKVIFLGIIYLRLVFLFGASRLRLLWSLTSFIHSISSRNCIQQAWWFFSFGWTTFGCWLQGSSISPMYFYWRRDAYRCLWNKTCSQTWRRKIGSSCNRTFESTYIIFVFFCWEGISYQKQVLHLRFAEIVYPVLFWPPFSFKCCHRR